MSDKKQFGLNKFMQDIEELRKITSPYINKFREIVKDKWYIPNPNKAVNPLKEDYKSDPQLIKEKKIKCPECGCSPSNVIILDTLITFQCCGLNVTMTINKNDK